MSRSPHCMKRFGPNPLYIEILAPYNPRVSDTVVRG
jgi:hypothetical protein